ncbi:MAG: GWxTD domain-containing protein [Candidatus Zophobacter franzmannii]|nr:GWxTD domain-containing protein [Candidatus Zophobacter franzmannii]
MKLQYTLLITLLLSSVFSLTASELKVENLGSFQRLVLYLDSSMIDFVNDSDTSTSDITLIIDNSDQDVVFKSIREITINKNRFHEKQYVVQFYYPNLMGGGYNLYYTFRNNKIGSSFKKNFNFTVKDELLSTLPIILDNSSFQVIQNVDDMKKIEDWSLNIAFTNVPESLLLKNSDSKIEDLPRDSIVVFIPDVDVRNKLDANTTLEWIVHGTTGSSKLGYEQVFLLYLGRYDLSDQFDQVRYIASQNEWKKLKKYKKENSLKAGLDSFWKVYDTGYESNSLRVEFYKRIIEADNRFSFRRYKKGWMTDRGRVLIKYGLPDEVVAEHLPLDIRPYIIWYYYSLDKQFLFQDLKGFGDYELKNTHDED